LERVSREGYPDTEKVVEHINKETWFWPRNEKYVVG